MSDNPVGPTQGRHSGTWGPGGGPTIIDTFTTAIRRAIVPMQNFGRQLDNVARAAPAAAGGGGHTGASGKSRWNQPLTGNEFIERRLSWMGWSAAQGGAHALNSGLNRAFQNWSGPNTGALFSNAVTTSALQSLHSATGLNLGGIAQQTSAAEETARMTTQIARVGGRVYPAQREALYKINLAAEQRAYEENLEITKLMERQYGKGSFSTNEDNMGGVLLGLADIGSRISSALDAIKAAIVR